MANPVTPDGEDHVEELASLDGHEAEIAAKQDWVLAFDGEAWEWYVMALKAVTKQAHPLGVTVEITDRAGETETCVLRGVAGDDEPVLIVRDAASDGSAVGRRRFIPVNDAPIVRVL